MTPLCMTGIRQSIVLCGHGRSFHTMHPVCTGGFDPPVGDVGNKGHVRPLPHRFSKTPEFHSRDLENSPPCQVNTFQTLRNNFHFSSLNYGCYWLFLLSTSSFPHTRRTVQAPVQRSIAPRAAQVQPPATNPLGDKVRQLPQNPEICTLFPPTLRSRR